MGDLSKDAQKIMDLVKDMSAVDLNQLVKGLEEEFGVTAAATVVAGAGGGDAGGDAGGAEGKDTVNIELTEIGQQKISIIKIVKELMGLGLKESKELVEKAPTILKENVKSEEADGIKEQLESAGATVSFK